MKTFSFSSRLEPMACLSIVQEWEGNTLEEARLSCCSLGMIPDGPLSQQEIEMVISVYDTDGHMMKLLADSFDMYNK